MSITSEVTREPSQDGDGIETVFTYSFRILDEDYISVYLLDDDGTENLQVIVTDYSVSGVGDANGGSITFVTAPTATQKVISVRSRPVIHSGDLANATAEGYFDNLYEISLRLLDGVERALKKNITDQAYFDAVNLQIKNVGAAVLSTDAINYSQLTAIANAVLYESEYIGAWTTSTAYVEANIVSHNSALYYCILAHTSGASTEPDVGGSWTTNWIALAKDLSADPELSALAALTSAANKIPMYTGSGTATLLDFKDEDTMSSDSATALASQQSIKAYVDAAAPAASLTVAGLVELATTAEVSAGTDTGRAVTPDALAGSVFGTKSACVTVFAPAADAVVGDGAAYLTIPSAANGMDLVSVHARTVAAGVTGTLSIQIHNLTQTQDMLSTLLTVDTGETGSDTAATPAAINTSNDDVATNDLLRIDVDTIHTGTASQGLLVTMEFRLP